MKKQSLVILFSLLVFGFANAQSSKNVKVSSFDEIHLGGSFDVILEKGKKENVRMQGSEKDLEKILVEVDGNELKIRIKRGVHRVGKVKVTITFQELNAIHSSGSSDISSSDMIDTNSFSVRCSGSGDIDLKVTSKSVSVKISGSGDITLSGAADKQEITISGSSDIDLLELKGKSCDIKISGSGNAKVNVSDALSARVSGSGDIKYKGSPEIQNFKVSGSGSVRKMN